MIELKGFPWWRNQLADVKSADGKPAENASYDCVPEELAACIQFYTGHVVAADDLKDAVYGQGHVGGGDELRYAKLLREKYGLALGYEPHRSGSLEITDAIRGYLKRGIPCIVTMQSDWNAVWGRARFGGYHVGCAWAISETDAGVLHVANPWHGFDHVRPVNEWAARLGIGVWPVTRLAPALPALPAGWHDDGETLTCPNGQPVVKGFRAYVLGKLQARQWLGGDAYGPEWGDATSSRQLFAAALLEWTPQRGVYEGSITDALALAAHLKEGKAA